MQYWPSATSCVEFICDACSDPRDPPPPNLCLSLCHALNRPPGFNNPPNYAASPCTLLQCNVSRCARISTINKQVAAQFSQLQVSVQFICDASSQPNDPLSHPLSTTSGWKLMKENWTKPSQMRRMQQGTFNLSESSPLALEVLVSVIWISVINELQNDQFCHHYQLVGAGVSALAPILEMKTFLVLVSFASLASDLWHLGGTTCQMGEGPGEARKALYQVSSLPVVPKTLVNLIFRKAIDNFIEAPIEEIIKKLEKSGVVDKVGLTWKEINIFLIPQKLSYLSSNLCFR